MIHKTFWDVLTMRRIFGGGGRESIRTTRAWQKQKLIGRNIFCGEKLSIHLLF